MNPLQKGIKGFITTHISPSHLSQNNVSPDNLISSLPKRYTIYEPMLLLSPNAFTHPPAWRWLYESLKEDQKDTLYASIASEFKHLGITHIAVNAPIILTNSQGFENRMRSPSGLVPLLGDFGPPVSGDHGPEKSMQSTETEYKRAFWVRTVQNHGIVQTWAPLYTMFSRGNITEKARIVDCGSTFEGLDGVSLCGEGVQDVAVVDMYAGIGYFVFSYLKRGVKRVWGWEINGWSVEGLRRGCVENGWGVKVVEVASDGQLNVPVSELVGSLRETDRVVVFHGDNRFAAGILREIRCLMCIESPAHWIGIRHVNLGLLPTSRDSWSSACEIIDENKGGWVHLHENVDVHEIEDKKGEISANLQKLWSQLCNIRPGVECRHVEQVKTYAPGVMHCVFDFRLSAY
ncbi:S-adenosyl-L-methionine-dependent methyltransferase [Aspergillus californicus]